MLNQRRTLLVAAAAMCLSALSAARAADYPVKPITVVVGYAAGGPTDVLMRAMAPRLTEDLKQQILVDNRLGANEIIAAQIVAKSPPDGYTLFLCTEAPLTQNQFRSSKLNCSPKNRPSPRIAQLLSAPMTFIVPTTLPVPPHDRLPARLRRGVRGGLRAAAPGARPDAVPQRVVGDRSGRGARGRGELVRAGQRAGGRRPPASGRRRRSGCSPCSPGAGSTPRDGSRAREADAGRPRARDGRGRRGDLRRGAARPPRDDRRPGPRVRGLENLVRAGGTAHPGGGLPLVALAGELAGRIVGPA